VPAPLPAPLSVRLAPVGDLDALGAAWRALEAEADGSFFQSWTWLGCRAAERFPDPLLLTAAQEGRVVGLALCNRTRRLGLERLWLGESGDAALDAVWIEHNGVLLAREAAHILPRCLAALLGGRRVVRLAGVDAAHLAAARAAGAVRLRRAQPAPCIDLAALPPGPEAWLASLSANTRYQLRRSDRHYAAAGPITLRRAATLAEAEAMLAALAALHQARWQARGRAGAFANPDFLRFHRALLARALPRGEAELLCIAAGGQAIGYLYNFRFRGRVLAYQAGFAYAGAGRHGKPGLTCHHAAIARARAEGASVYDFLAGADRYKTSFANAATALHWLDLAPRWSSAGAWFALRGRVEKGFRR
jgi:CelD/BcsL family acetyltransferase involved in cellulose biosynthesis